MAVVHKMDEVSAMMKESGIQRVDADESCELQLENAVRQQLMVSGHCGLRNLQVGVERDAVLLSGEVSTYFLKQAAQEAARIVCPNHQVRNLIMVREPEAGAFPGSFSK